MGAPAVVREGMTSLAAALPDQLRERIASAPFPEMWVAAFEARLRRGERDAVRLYPELLRMVGANDAAMELALRALGVSLEIAKRAVGAYREIEHLDEAGQAEYSLRGLQDYFAARGRRLVLLDDAGPANENGGANGTESAG